MDWTDLFECTRDFPIYAGKPNTPRRLGLRHKFLIEPFADAIKGARVLDLAAHDGRWSYAFANAGAREVVAIEGRAELVADFQRYPDADLKARVKIRQGDIYEELLREADRGEQYDVVALFGIMYHVMDHFFLLRQIMRLNPKLIIIDSEFMQGRGNIIQLLTERTDNNLNAIEQIEGQKIALKGVLSVEAMEAMAKALGCAITWLDWSTLPQRYHKNAREYFREGNKIRKTCVLTNI